MCKYLCREAQEEFCCRVGESQKTNGNAHNLAPFNVSSLKHNVKLKSRLGGTFKKALIQLKSEDFSLGDLLMLFYVKKLLSLFTQLLVVLFDFEVS